MSAPLCCNSASCWHGRRRVSPLRLMGLAADQVQAGDAVTALLLAREGLPCRFAPEPDRPVVAGFWPVLHDALVAQREILVLRGHEAALTSAGFSADGTRIVTGSCDGTARVWRADGSGEPAWSCAVTRASVCGRPGSARTATRDGHRVARTGRRELWGGGRREGRARGPARPRGARSGRPGSGPDGTRMVTASRGRDGASSGGPTAAASPCRPARPRERGAVRRVQPGRDPDSHRLQGRNGAGVDGSGEPLVLRGHGGRGHLGRVQPRRDQDRQHRLGRQDARAWRADGDGRARDRVRPESRVMFSYTLGPVGTRIVTASWDGWRGCGGSRQLVFARASFA